MLVNAGKCPNGRYWWIAQLAPFKLFWSENGFQAFFFCCIWNIWFCYRIRRWPPFVQVWLLSDCPSSFWFQTHIWSPGILISWLLLCWAISQDMRKNERTNDRGTKWNRHIFKRIYTYSISINFATFLFFPPSLQVNDRITYWSRTTGKKKNEKERGVLEVQTVWGVVRKKKFSRSFLFEQIFFRHQKRQQR